ncbi:GNAT family N-acetyltransferase [Bacillus gaemokensis]|uniref:Acetyltransferase n=1 Tax=Bacillus gaemokensis TaxID=574375 RepID=A0A073KAA2_9BACI|nr:GNAT family N-acetyltransferase [Bacillus gaemokensis]KEK23470.1 acetyltransferase [Bacillus gaemokensis]KYG27162.1 acetyltransferase [Bacillus gaemokensis]
MNIMKFDRQDTEEIIHLFYDTVHSVNAKDYSESQLDAWAPKEEKQSKVKIWRDSLHQNITYVAKINDMIVGFSDIMHTGYLDRLFVHKGYQGKGIATALIEKIELEARKLNLQEINTNASITAKRFFQRRGYNVVSEQQVERKGITLTNFHMRKEFN